AYQKIIGVNPDFSPALNNLAYIYSEHLGQVDRAYTYAQKAHQLRPHIKVVGTVNYAETFPACRAVVHHGGAGTTAASLRAGVPTLVLWSTQDQSIWGAQVKRLKVGTVRRFSATTRESLVEDLRQILASEYATRAREIATRMTKPSDSVARAADILQNLASSRRRV
ncbi:MAG TPA: nucleotide disphospho-sugar-binding domain-containing protein, partial [Mycobacterium sp.]